MKILHITPSYKPAYIYGGPIVSVSRLCESQASLGYDIVVYTTTANGKNELFNEQKILDVDGVQVAYFPRITGDHTHVSLALWWHLWKTVRQYQVVHIHSWWNFLVMGAVWVCWLRGVKPVLSPRGMLSTYSFTHENSIKKKVLHLLIGKWLLKKTYLHATATLELDDCFQVISGWTGFVAPNIIGLPTKSYPRNVNQIFTIGFFSRIDPKKGLDLLIQALGKCAFPFRLLIAGSGDEGYLSYLKQLVREMRIDDQVEWVGWKSGEEKYEFLANIDLMALTSYNENFANVVLESLAVGTPVLLSKNVGLYDTVQTYQWGWTTTLDQEDIIDTLNQSYQAKQRRLQITHLAPQQVRELFDAGMVAQQYIQSYFSIR